MASSVDQSGHNGPEVTLDSRAPLPATSTGAGLLEVRKEKLVAGLLLLFAVSFNLVALYPEVSIDAPMVNNGVMHFLALERMADAWAGGNFSIDLWLPSIALGYPLYHEYQHLPYLVQTILFQLLPESVALSDLFRWTNYLLLSFFPLSIYWSMRQFGFGRLTAALAGLVSSLLATNGLYGFDFSSYTWSGYGLYTQLWGMFFLPPALAAATVYMRSGRGLFLATLLLVATVLSDLLLGYMALVSLAAILFLSLVGPMADEKRLPLLWLRGKRLLFLFAMLALVTAYFWLPYLLDSPFINHSVWEDPAKLNAYGLGWTLSALVRGELLDFGRFPSLTLLAAAGLLVSLRHWREEKYRIPVILFVLWLLLYFGRPLWGSLLELLPFSSDLHFHRFIAGVHLGGIYLSGIALAYLWQWAWAQGKVRAVTAVTIAIATLLLLIPVYWERAQFLAQNERMMIAAQTAYEQEKGELDAVLETIAGLPPGRVYAGHNANWGQQYTIGDIPLYAILNSAGLDMVGNLYHTLSLNADIQLLFDEALPEHYDLFNVRYIVAPAGQEFPEFVHPVASFGRHTLYQVRTSGYFELVRSNSTLPVTNDQYFTAVSAWLNSDQLEEKEHPGLVMQGRIAALEQSLDSLWECETPIAQDPTHPLYSHIISEKLESDAYSAVVHVERPSCLMLKTTYHPNWHVTVDGAETQTSMLMPSYVGIRVVPGTHLVQVEYRPRPQKQILVRISLLVLGILFVLHVQSWLTGLPAYAKLRRT